MVMANVRPIQNTKALQLNKIQIFMETRNIQISNNIYQPCMYQRKYDATHGDIQFHLFLLVITAGFAALS